MLHTFNKLYNKINLTSSNKIKWHDDVLTVEIHVKLNNKICNSEELIIYIKPFSCKEIMTNIITNKEKKKVSKPFYKKKYSYKQSGYT